MNHDRNDGWLILTLSHYQRDFLSCRLSVYRWSCSQGGKWCYFDMQLWCQVLRLLTCVLGPRSYSQQWLCKWGDQVRWVVGGQQTVRALPAQRFCPWWCVVDHQAGTGERLRDVWLPCGHTRLVQWSKTPCEVDCGARWEPLRYGNSTSSHWNMRKDKDEIWQTSHSRWCNKAELA